MTIRRRRRKRRWRKERLRSQAVLPDILTPSGVCVLSPWKLGECLTHSLPCSSCERAASVHSAAAAAAAAPLRFPSHTVVESSLLFSG